MKKSRRFTGTDRAQATTYTPHMIAPERTLSSSKDPSMLTKRRYAQLHRTGSSNPCRQHSLRNGFESGSRTRADPDAPPNSEHEQVVSSILKTASVPVLGKRDKAEVAMWIEREELFCCSRRLSCKCEAQNAVSER